MMVPLLFEIPVQVQEKQQNPLVPSETEMCTPKWKSKQTFKHTYQDVRINTYIPCTYIS